MPTIEWVLYGALALLAWRLLSVLLPRRVDTPAPGDVRFWQTLDVDRKRVDERIDPPPPTLAEGGYRGWFPTHEPTAAERESVERMTILFDGIRDFERREYVMRKEYVVEREPEGSPDDWQW